MERYILENGTRIEKWEKTDLKPEVLSHDGTKLKLKAFHSWYDCEVEFPDGAVAEHICAGTYQFGNVMHPDFQALKPFAVKNTGDVVYTENGERYCIIDGERTDLTIMTGDGLVVYHRSLYQCRRGYFGTKRLGKVAESTIDDVKTSVHEGMTVTNKDGDGAYQSGIIHHALVKKWGIDVQTLADQAMTNMFRYEPANIQDMDEALYSILCELMGKEPTPEMRKMLIPKDETAVLYPITTKSGLHGASCLLYPGLLKNFADGLQSDLLVIPSSIHDCILVPTNRLHDYDSINEKIGMVNQQNVPEDERLSDHTYLYRRDAGKLEMVEDIPANGFCGNAGAFTS